MKKLPTIKAAPYRIQPGCHNCAQSHIVMEFNKPYRICLFRRGRPRVVAAGVCGEWKKIEEEKEKEKV